MSALIIPKHLLAQYVHVLADVMLKAASLRHVMVQAAALLSSMHIVQVES